MSKWVYMDILYTTYTWLVLFGLYNFNIWVIYVKFPDCCHMRSRLIIGRDELDRNEGNRSRTLPSSPSSSPSKLSPESMVMTSSIPHRRSKNETVAISSKHHSWTLDCLHIAIGLTLLRRRHLSFSPRPLVRCVVSSFASSALSVVLCLRRPSSPYDEKSNVLMTNLISWNLMSWNRMSDNKSDVLIHKR